MGAQDEPNLAHFLSIPWCAKTLGSSDWVSRPVVARIPKADTEDELFARTLQTPTTISHMLYAYPALVPGQPIAVFHGYATLAVGLNGFADVCHGGIVATIIDEFQGMSLTAARLRERDLAVERGELARDAKQGPSMTAELTVRYVRPVKTPQTVCVVTRIKEVKGRKLWMDSEMVDEHGTVLATGKGLFIQVATSSVMSQSKM